jgi:hypothetical protein
MVVPPERQAGGQGVLGACSTLTAGVTALVTGVLYEHAGRTVAYGAAAAAMVLLVAAGARLAGPAWRMRGGADVPPSGIEELVR